MTKHFLKLNMTHSSSFYILSHMEGDCIICKKEGVDYYAFNLYEKSYVPIYVFTDEFMKDKIQLLTCEEADAIIERELIFMELES